MPNRLLPLSQARGALAVVAAAVKRAIAAGESREIPVFEDSDARTVEIDFPGAPPNVAMNKCHWPA
jgi:hypothetical protein